MLKVSPEKTDIEKFREEVKECYCLPQGLHWLKACDELTEILWNSQILLENTRRMMEDEYYE